MAKKKRLWGCIQLKPFHTKSCQISWFPMGTLIILDKKKPYAKKLHQITWQSGPSYGSVGDMTEYITHEELLELEQQGAITIQRN
jgi:hypothetical protein